MGIYVLALSHGVGYAGAQIPTLEFFELVKDGAELRVVVGGRADKGLANDVESLGLPVRAVETVVRMGYLDMDVESVRDWVEWANVVWLTDIEFPAAPMVKRVRKDVPVVAHLRSYALICPWWGALYGFRDVCTEKCPLWRITRCKQGINLELARPGILSSSQASIYYMFDSAR